MCGRGGGIGHNVCEENVNNNNENDSNYEWELPEKLEDDNPDQLTKEDDRDNNEDGKCDDCQYEATETIFGSASNEHRSACSDMLMIVSDQTFKKERGH